MIEFQSTSSSPIFVTGVWKSGNHLVYSTLNQLGIEGPFNGFAAHLLHGKWRVAKRVLRGSFSSHAGINVGLETDAFVRPSYLRHSLRNLSGKIVGGHAAYSDRFYNLLCSERARILVIRRDPRDVLVSFADWIGSRPDYFMHADFVDLSREQRIIRLLRGGSGSGYSLSPFEEVLSKAQPWLSDKKDVLSLSFESLIGPNGGGDRSEQLRSISAICSHIRITPPKDPSWIERIYGGSLTFNHGKVARWQELNSVDLTDEIKERLADHINLWGYEY